MSISQLQCSVSTPMVVFLHNFKTWMGSISWHCWLRDRQVWNMAHTL